MGRYILTLPDDQLSRLRDLSSQTGVPMAEYVRRGLDMVLSPSSAQMVISGNLASGCVMLVMRG